VANTACSTCHAGYANAPTSASTISAVNATAHMNGTLDVIGQSCTSCHGDATRTPVATATDLDALGASLVKAAPPNDSTGLAASALVGAHLAHVNQGATTPAMSSALKCINCHSGLVPTAAPHSVPANPVAWGNLATARGAVPTTYATANRNCSSTYCHGQFSPYGKTGNTVNWGTGTSAKLACNGCHGQSVAAPQPGYPHPQNTTCASCHTGYTSTTAAAATHVDGLTTKSTTGCTACHGDRADTAVTLTTNTFKAAPGATGATTTADTTGATTGASVGAHRAHLVGSTGTPRWRTTALTCTECHALPASNTDVTHATGTGTGGARATLTWGILAADTAFGARTPTYTQPTCAATYCHSPRADTTAGLNQTPSWTGATTTVVCGSCHGLPPVAGSHPANTACSTCHTGYANAPTSASTITAVNATTHMNGTLDAAGGDCVGCHNTAQGTRRAIVPEFALAWSHKRSGGGTVTKFDCVVCHMEGDATGNTTAVHQNGLLDLRDPDTGLTIKGVTWGGTGAGAYTSTTADMTFAKFSRNLASATLEPAVQAIMINQCLKCHDADGALSPLARVPTTGTAAKPFGTTIAGTAYTGAGVTAGGTLGGVTDVAASFNTANASYHPVRGKQNNSYVGNLRMNAPWNALSPAKVAGTTTSWGYLISCWDCHAPLGTASTVTLTATVTAHGGATTLRQAYWAVNATNLCTVCHLVVPVTGSSTTSHGAGSAFSGGGHSGPGGIARTSCYRCHGSLDASKPARPISAQDVHGFDAFASSAGTGDTMWPVGTTNTYKPYGFMRNAGSASGMWKTTSWRPLSGPGVPTGGATCGGSATLGSGCGSENHGVYTPGGVY
jgi:predicted CxxxxCH...CXXCH cytochrome family protein